MPPPRDNAYNLGVCPSKATKLKTSKLPIHAYKSWEFRKNIANESPLKYKFLAKIRNFDSFGVVFPHFCPDKRESWHGGAAPVPRTNFHVYRGNVSCTLRGEKPFFGPVSKNNTGMAALHADLPVTRNQYASPPRGSVIPAGPLSDSDEILCCWWIPKSSALFSKILTLSVIEIWA